MKKLLLILILAIFSFSYKSQAQVYNGGFEIVNSDGSVRNWGNVMLMVINVTIDSTGNPVYDSLVIDGGAYSQLSNDAHGGNYAMQLSNSYNFTTNEDRAGIITADDDSVFAAWGNFNLIPTNSIPAELNFYYKYLPVNGEMGLATIQVFDGPGTQIGESYFALTATGSSYVNANVPINYTGNMNDAVFYNLSFTTALPGTPAALGTRLFLDDISLSTTTSLNENTKENSFSIYPNPATNRIIINGNIKENTIPYVYGLGGQIVPVTIGGLSSGGGVISVEELPNGIYMLELRTGNNIERQKFVIAK